MDQQELRAVARKIVRDCAGVKQGENVYIEGRADSLPYLELLALECELVGARPMLVAVSDEHRVARLMELSTEQLSSMSTCWIEAVKAADVVFTVRLEDGKPGLFRDVADDKFGAALSGRKQLADWIYDGTRRWIGTDFPTKEQAKAFDLDFAACGALLARPRRRLCGAAGARRGSSPPSFTARDQCTSRHLRDGRHHAHRRPAAGQGRSVVGGADGSNLPAGEVCLAPLGDGGRRHRRLRPRRSGTGPRRGPRDPLRAGLCTLWAPPRLRDVRRVVPPRRPVPT